MNTNTPIRHVPVIFQTWKARRKLIDDYIRGIKYLTDMRLNLVFTLVKFGLIARAVYYNQKKRASGIKRLFSFQINHGKKRICAGIFYLASVSILAQTQIAMQNFETTGSHYDFSYTQGILQTGISSSSDRMAAAAFYSGFNTAFRVTNQTATLDFAEIMSLEQYHSKQIKFRIAAFSINSSSNGLDAGDKVKLVISLDGGNTFSEEIRIRGFSNAWWHYATGTAIAQHHFDGDNIAIESGPSGGGNRTVDGYSTVILDLPDSCTRMKLRIMLNTDSNNEAWLIDDVILSGCLTEWLNCPQDTTVCLQQGMIPLIGAEPSGGIYSGKGVNAGFFDPLIAGSGVHQIKYKYQYDCGEFDSCFFMISVLEHALINLRSGLEYCSLQQAMESTEIQDGDEIRVYAGNYLGAWVHIQNDVKWIIETQKVIIDKVAMDGINKLLELTGDVSIRLVHLSNGHIVLKGTRLYAEKITGAHKDSYIITD